MNAGELVKKEKDIESIYNEIQRANERCEFKIPIFHFLYVSDRTKLELMNNGFKVYTGQWDGIMGDCLIIEW